MDISDFEENENVAATVDCFEMFIKGPSNLYVRAQTWSSYKHHNKSAFIKNLLPRDIVLAEYSDSCLHQRKKTAKWQGGRFNQVNC